MNVANEINKWNNFSYEERNEIFTEVVKTAMLLRTFYPYKDVQTSDGNMKMFHCDFPCGYSLIFIGEWYENGACMLEFIKPNKIICKFAWEFCSKDEGSIVDVVGSDKWKSILSLFNQDLKIQLRKLEGFEY